MFLAWCTIFLIIWLWVFFLTRILQSESWSSWLEADIQGPEVPEQIWWEEIIAQEQIVQDLHTYKAQLPLWASPIENDTVTWSITILIPPFVEKNDIQTLTTYIKTKSNIHTTIHHAKTPYTYKKSVEQSIAWENQYDIILAPSNWMQSLQQRWTALPQQDILGFFDPSVHTIVEEAYMVPFLIDPYLTITTPSNISKIKEWTSWAHIQNTTYAHPDLHLLFGIHTQDIILLENQKSAYQSYTDILLRVLEQSKQDTHTYALAYLKDTKARSPSKFLKKFKNIEQTPWCSARPLLCVFAHTDNNLAFIRSSDISILETIFSSYIMNKDIAYMPFPTETTKPATVRGWIIHSDKKNLSTEALRIDTYITYMIEETNILTTPLISAFLAQSTQDKKKTYYEYFGTDIHRLKPVIWSLDQRENMIKQTPLLSLLKWTYDPTIYIQRYIQ